MTETKQGLLIFDFDGVFNVGSQKLYEESYLAALADSGAGLSYDEAISRIRLNWGSPHQAIIGELLLEQPELLPTTLKLYEQNLTTIFTEGIQEVPGCVETLGRLSTDYILALNTAADRKTLLNSVMPRLGIDPSLFDGGILTADILEDESLAKPEPFSVQFLMGFNEVSANRTVMVGDSSADMLSAIHAGVEPIAVIKTGNLDETTARDLGVRHIIEDITHIEAVLPSIIGKTALKSSGTVELPPEAVAFVSRLIDRVATNETRSNHEPLARVFPYLEQRYISR